MRAVVLLSLVACAQTKAPEPVLVQVEAGAAPVAASAPTERLDAAPSAEVDGGVVCGPDDTPLLCQLRSAGTKPADGSAPFDRSRASDALRVDVTMCARPNGLRGAGHVKLKLETTGIPSAVIVEPPWAGTPEGACVLERFKAVRVPPFRGAPVSVGKSFVLN